MSALRAILALTALGTVIVAGTGCSGSASIEVRTKSGVHASATVRSDHTVSGGVTTHVVSVGESELRTHVFGIEGHIADCDSEYTARADEVGRTTVHNFVITCEGSTSVQACSEAQAHQAAPTSGGTSWVGNASGGGETAPNTVAGQLTLCITTSSGVRCEGAAPMSVNTASQPYVTTLNDARIGSSLCEVDGMWSEEVSSMDIQHL